MKRKLKIFILKLKVTLKKIFTKKAKRAAILVSNTWKNKVSDDLLLQLELLNNGIYTDIIAYDIPNDYSKYNLVIIRSIWGYEKNLQVFEDLLSKLDKQNITILNNSKILKDNYNKEKQISLLEQYNIPHIDTTIIKKNTKDIKSIIQNINNGQNIVIKPSISASGNNTYLITENKSRDNHLTLAEVNNTFKDINTNTSLLVQPFIKEIDNGELSLIYINGSYSHAILRYPNVFNNKSSITYIDKNSIDDKALTLANKVLTIKEYQDNLYERIDMVKINDEYLIMELELVEPDLFIRNITDEKIKQQVIQNLAKSIKEKI